MRVALKTLGCRLNEAELENWSNDFQKLGHEISTSIEHADLVVINTCAVTQEAVKKSRQIIRRSQRQNPQAKLVVSGCYSSLNPDIKNEIPGIDLLVSNQDKDRLAEMANEQLLPEFMPNLATEPEQSALFHRGRHRAFVKVQDGCRYRCTFCIVTVARGDEKSKQISTIVDEVNTLSLSGVKEVVLTGVHIGGYGSDTNSDLYTLIKTILENTDIPRLRLGSVEPWDLGDNFFELFSNPRFMPHLHLPLQSGSDSILRRMGRRCKTAEFASLLNIARSQINDFKATTDIIVAFPGETDLDWRDGLEFIEECDFSHIHIFPYSIRQGTKAATFPGQVPADIKKQRARELHVLAENMRTRNLSRIVGKTYPVLIENRIENDDKRPYVYQAYTPNYIKVKVDAGENSLLENQIVNVRINNYEQNSPFVTARIV